MQFLLINSNKIKISLTKDDIIEYSVNKTEDGEGELSKRAISQILAIAKEKVGFISSGYRLLIQFYPLGDGGELFVTRLLGLTENKERLLRTAGNITLISPSVKIFLFDSVNALANVISRFNSVLSVLDLTLYYEEKCGYYLIVRDKEGDGSTLNGLCEYAREVTDALIPYIEEHAKRICDGERVLSLAELSPM